LLIVNCFFCFSRKDAKTQSFFSFSRKDAKTQRRKDAKFFCFSRKDAKTQSFFVFHAKTQRRKVFLFFTQRRKALNEISKCLKLVYIILSEFWKTYLFNNSVNLIELKKLIINN